MARLGDLKIGSIGGATHVNFLERSVVISTGRKDAADSEEDSQVSVVKRIASGNRSEAGSIAAPGPEGSVRDNFTRRGRVGECRAKHKFTAGRGRTQVQVLDFKIERFFARSAGQNFQRGIFGNDFAETDITKLSHRFFNSTHVRRRIFLPRRNVELQSIEVDKFDAAWISQKSPKRCPQR